MNQIKKIIPVTALLVAFAVPAQALAAPKGKVQFGSSAYAVAEDDASGAATITVIRRNVPKATLSQSVLVDFATSDGTAKAGVDYTAASGTVTFPACGSSPSASDPCRQQTFNVPVINNSVIDGARTVKLKLSHPRTASGGRAQLGFPSTATLVIADDDGNATTGSTFQTAAATDIVSETATSEPLFIVRSGDLSATASVNYATSDGAAIAGTDYTAVSGTANFTAGSAQSAILQEVDVPILHNPASSPATRDFSLNLSIPGGTTGQLGSPSSETVTIVNSDGAPQLAFATGDYSANESDGSVRLTVLASGSITGTDEVDVDYATSDGTAIAGTNYTSTSDTLQFFAGDVAASFDVPVLADGQPGDKYFTAGLSNPTGSGVLGTPSTATVTIHNTDAPSSSGTGSNAGDTTGTGTSGGQPQGGAQEVLGARTAACGLTVKAAKAQKLRKKVLTLQLRAGARCKVTITTTVKQFAAKGKKHSAQIVRALRLSGKKASLTLQPGKAKTVQVKFTKKTLKAITKALRARKQLVATIVVTTRDSASKVSHKTLKVTIRR